MKNYVSRNYGVIFKYFKNETEFTRVHFKVEVVYKGMSQYGKHHFSIDKKQVFIDHSAPDLIIEQLAEKAGSCFYPMEIVTSAEGPLEEIINFEEIKKRWDLKKEELEKYYVGEIAEKIINKANRIYSSKRNIEHAIKEDLFLKLFFMPIYRKHNNQIAEYDIDISFVPFTSPKKYSIVQEVNRFLTKSGKQQINLKSNNDSDKIQPEIDLNYKVNNETKSIFSIIGKVNLEAKSSTKGIDIEMYQLEDN